MRVLIYQKAQWGSWFTKRLMNKSNSRTVIIQLGWLLVCFLRRPSWYFIQRGFPNHRQVGDRLMAIELLYNLANWTLIQLVQRPDESRMRTNCKLIFYPTWSSQSSSVKFSSLSSLDPWVIVLSQQSGLSKQSSSDLLDWSDIIRVVSTSSHYSIV